MLGPHVLRLFVGMVPTGGQQCE